MKDARTTKPANSPRVQRGDTLLLVPEDTATEQCLMKLMLLMFSRPEFTVEYFSPYSEPFAPPLKAAIDRGDMFLLKSESFYYKDHRRERTYVFIPPAMAEAKSCPKWKRERVAKSPVFVKSTLSLSNRKKQELAVWFGTVGADADHQARRIEGFTYDIFLSYSERDRSVASEVGGKLERAGARVFMAQQPGATGGVFTEELRISLLESREIWLIVSPDNLRSEWAMAEWGAAWVLGKKLVSVLHGCPVPQFPLKPGDLCCVGVTGAGELIKDHLNTIHDSP